MWKKEQGREGKTGSGDILGKKVRVKNASAGTRTRISTLEGWNSALRPQMLTVIKNKEGTS